MLPGPTSLKNKSLAADMLLGEGDMLQTQVDDQLALQKKQKLNPATAGLSPAVASLLGLTGGM